jgi:hypothetical protein
LIEMFTYFALALIDVLAIAVAVYADAEGRVR